MDPAGAKNYKERWRKVNELTLREHRELSPETKLLQSTGLLRLARRLGWDLSRRESEIRAVRKNWNLLRERFRERQSG
ncbi:MAG: hypothetical protein JXB06_10965 [Spirochaetales bacterium]|nr:hypothetical protein [Spirochaetales bacterium]